MTLYFFIPCPIFDIYKSESLVFGSTFKKDDSIFTYVNSTIYLVTEEIINNGRLKYFLKKISPKYFRSTFFLSPHPQNIIQRISNITQQVMTFAHRIYTYPRVYHSSPPPFVAFYSSMVSRPKFSSCNRVLRGSRTRF